MGRFFWPAAMFGRLCGVFALVLGDRCVDLAEAHAVDASPATTVSPLVLDRGHSDLRRLRTLLCLFETTIRKQTGVRANHADLNVGSSVHARSRS
jgi:hypothetical protein